MKAMKAWKGLLVAVLLLCSFLCVASVNTSAVSAAGEHTHPICGKTHTDIGDHTAAKCETVTYTAWDGTFASSGMPDIDYSNNDTAYVYLTRSVEITYELEIPKGKTLYLCLNGYTITKTEMSDTWSAVILSRSGNTHFILCDCKGGGTITHADGVLGRGVRSGNSNGYDKSSFTMYGGTISGNRVGGDTSGDDGAGVFVQSGTFTMYGGKITDNHVEKSLNDGGGVLFRSDDTFIMYGGEISNNYSVDYGGGIIAIGYGSVELRGGTISGNTSDALGGAIWSNKSVTIYEGVNITGNKAVDGGGISTYNTSLTIKGGNITNNTVTTGNGGGVYLNGGTFTISGNVKISGNKKGSSANNVYLPKGETISVIGELTGTTPIGITTKAVPSSSAYVRLAFGRAEYLDPAKFQYENDSNISLVTVGSSSSSSLIACKHNWGTTWQADASGHWHECSLCGGKQAAAEHSGGKATCTESAVCSTCNTPYGEPLGHDFTSDVWQKDETNHWKKCSRCEATDQTAAHTWEDEITLAATCTATGIKTYTCTTCLKTKTETISAKGHNFAKKTGQAATCLDSGWEDYNVCSLCNYVTDYKQIAALGHDFTSSAWQSNADEHWKKCSRCDETTEKTAHVWKDKITAAATCTATGEKTFTCTVCSTTKTETLNALGHELIQHEAKAATCLESGWDAYDTCSRCSYTTFEKIAALGHDKIHHEAQEATCLNIGWNAYDTCTRCSYTTYVEIGKLGHDFTSDVWQKDENEHWKKCSRCDETEQTSEHTWNEEITVAATCTAAGLKTYTCIDCRATKTETIAANGHNLTAHEAKAATCTEFGWKVYEDCADCDYTTYVEIAAFGHDFTGSVWQQDENKHWKKCSRCDEIDQAAEHTFGDGEITLEPTCTATGLKTYTCTVCFETKTETIDALGHDEVQHDGKAATCTEFGWKPYVTCNRCEYTTHEKLNALGHDKIHHEAKAATCLEIGYNAYDTCSRCDYTTYVEIAALGHDEIHHDGKAATCTEIGWNAYDTCSRCDYTTYVEIAALGHDEIHHEAKAATCTEIGYNAYDTCSRCDYTTYEEIAALGHDEIHHEAKAATCTEIGYNAYDTCSRCDYTTYVEIAALGHDFTAATWQSNADEHWKNCARCDATAEKASHAGGTATCKDVAVCSTCSATYGELNPDNHAGGTEIRDMVEATAEKVGHTGNSYCKGCNAKIADGKVIPVTVDLSIDQKSDLETAAEAIEKFLSEQNESYTDEQKEELSGSINAIKSALESIARAEDAVSKIEAMPSAADAKPDDKTAIDAFEAAKAAYDALSDDEKRMTGDNSKTTLDAIFKALTAYAVTDGNGSTWAESDNSGLTFTVNGYHEKFAGLVINGETVDKKYYDVKAGSTVITLKAEYLKTLSAGKYTILVQYADGSTDGEDAFTVKENGSVTPPDSASSSSQPSESNSSQATESNKSIVIWIVIPILLIILLIILLLLLKNRKKSEKKK